MSSVINFGGGEDFSFGSTGGNFKSWTGLISYEPVLVNPTKEILEEHGVKRKSVADYEGTDSDGNKQIRISVWGWRRVIIEDEEVDKQFAEIKSFFIADTPQKSLKGTDQRINQYGDSSFPADNGHFPAFFTKNTFNDKVGDIDLTNRVALKGEADFAMFFTALFGLQRNQMDAKTNLIFETKHFFNGTVIKTLKGMFKNGCAALKKKYKEAPEFIGVKYLTFNNDKGYMENFRHALPLNHSKYQYDQFLKAVNYANNKKPMNYQNTFEPTEFTGSGLTPNGGSDSGANASTQTPDLDTYQAPTASPSVADEDDEDENDWL